MKSLMSKVKVKKYLQIFSLGWKLNKLYNKSFLHVLKEVQLSKSEADVLLFLYNNKSLDTARDIVEHRSLSKSLVSKSVESLLGKGFLSSATDHRDKRRIHLKIEPLAIPIVKTLRSVQKRATDILSHGITISEAKVLIRVLNKIQRNVESARLAKAKKLSRANSKKNGKNDEILKQ